MVSRCPANMNAIQIALQIIIHQSRKKHIIKFYQKITFNQNNKTNTEKLLNLDKKNQYAYFQVFERILYF